MSLEELEQRVTVLESEVAVVRQEAAAARALASGADRDVAEYRAELRGHTRVLNALRETQLEHGNKLVEHGNKLDQLTGAVNHIRDQHGAKLDDIAAMLTRLIDEKE